MLILRRPLPSATAHTGKLTFALRFCAYFIPFFCLALLLQVQTGVYRSELAHYPDEPAHLVSALMVRDYLAGGIPHSPLRFAENYYLHYPKVALGIYPPVFHTCAAIWMLIFSTSHRSLLIFMDVQCALAAVLIAFFVRRWSSAAMACIAGFLFISFYLVQYGTSLFMLDIMVTIMDLAATLLLIRFFRTEKTADAVWFGIVTSAAVLTKGNCIALVLVPPLMIVLLGRWSILKRPGMYVSAAIIALIGAPWQLATLRMLKNSVPPEPVSLHRLGIMFPGYAREIVESTGYLVLAIALAGIFFQLRGAPGPLRKMELAGIVSMGAAVYLFHVFSPYPGPESRYITPVLSVVAILFVSGIDGISRAIPLHFARQGWFPPVLALAVLAIYARTTFAIPRRDPMGYIAAVDALSTPEFDHGVILVAADGFGEGAAVEEVALRDHRPGRFVLRGSKVITEGRWSVRVHDALLKTPDEFEKYLLSVPVDAIIVDRTAPLWQEDTDMLLDTMRRHPQAWELYREIPAQGTGRNLLIYRYIGPRDPNAKRDIQLHMRFTLGRDLSF